MIYFVDMSNEAEADLRGIYEHIAFGLMSQANADGQLERIETKITSLSTMPERYRRYKKEPWFSRGLRVLPVDNFVIFYLVNVGAHIVTVMRIMYKGRDIEYELSKTTSLLSDRRKIK